MAQTPILTVTLNPALDLATSADEVRAGPKLRCESPRADAGGGGINVSRVIHRLRGGSTAFVALAGPTGDRVEALMRTEHLSVARHAAPSETRQSLSVTDRSTGRQFRFVLPGPVWTKAAGRAVAGAIAEAAPGGALVVISGSLPPGIPADLPAQVSRRVARAGGRVILDTSGEALARAAAAPHPAFVLRMDEVEAEALAGARPPSRRDSADFAESLVRRGAARVVVIARGAEGSVLATAEGRWFAEAADVPVASKIGAGDSFLGAFTLALARGRALPRALQEGMAAASATVMTEATELCHAADVRRLIAACRVSRV